jgi:hypothetical protein
MHKGSGSQRITVLRSANSVSDGLELIVHALEEPRDIRITLRGVRRMRAGGWTFALHTGPPAIGRFRGMGGIAPLEHPMRAMTPQPDER